MKWNKIGFISKEAIDQDWAQTHLQLPSSLVLNESTVRVFFASRNTDNHSSVGCLELKKQEDMSLSISEVQDHPVLIPGEPGHFDQHGVFPSCLVEDQGKFYLFYIGWTQGYEPPLFYASIGLAVSDDGKSFTKKQGPLVQRNKFDPCLVTSPHVFKDKETWKMTYVSGIKWTKGTNNTYQSHYHIKYMESQNIEEWNPQGDIAIDFKEEETNIARSSVIQLSKGLYSMWFGYVKSDIGKYRIGYADSIDGKSWNRDDKKSGISIDNEHATEMISYPCVFQLGKEIYMLYNGDNFGYEGFGIALLNRNV